MGDFNLNLYGFSVSIDFLAVLLSYGILPTTLKPTRVTEITAILFNNIFSSLQVVHSCVFVNNISDFLIRLSAFLKIVFPEPASS